MNIVVRLKACALRPAKLALLILIVMGIIYGLFIALSLLPGRNSHVVLEEKIYFEKIDSTTLRVTGYITNDGLTASGHVKVTMFVTDNTGTTVSKSDIDVGIISSETTSEVVITTAPTLSRNLSYSIELRVFENGKMLERGTTSQMTSYGSSWPGQGNLAKVEMSASKPTIPGFESFAVICSIGLAFLVFKKFRFKIGYK